jgi:hypothetical protein
MHPAEVDEEGLVRMEREPIPRKTLAQHRQDALGVDKVVERRDCVVGISAAKWSEHAAKFGAAANDWLRPVAERCETPAEHKPERVSQQTRFLQVLATVPDGPATTGLTLKQIRNLIEPEFTKRRWRLPSTDTIARALGRRRRG